MKEDYTKKEGFDTERDMIYSQTIKAGKRIYYIDVKRNKKGDLFLSITESKKIINGEGDEASFTFEKHKIFLYQEDFTKFIDGMSKAIRFIHEQNEEPVNKTTEKTFVAKEATETAPVIEKEEFLTDGPIDEKIDIDIDF